MSDLRVSWWGTYGLAIGEAAFLRVGPLSLWATRREHEWRLMTVRGDDALDATLDRRMPVDAGEIPSDAEPLRFGFGRAPEAVTILPVLADRPVVVRPEMAFYVPPGESVRMYVSTPLWLRVVVGEAEEAAHELPIHRPSDTWFGPTVMEGELCYASRSHLRLSADEVEFRPHRAVTELLLRNRAQDPLLLDRLKIPVEHLSVYAGNDGRLWTEPVTLVRDSDGDFAAVRIGERAPASVDGARLLTPARERADTNLVVRAFQALFHS